MDRFAVGLLISPSPVEKAENVARGDAPPLCIDQRTGVLWPLEFKSGATFQAKWLKALYG